MGLHACYTFFVVIILVFSIIRCSTDAVQCLQIFCGAVQRVDRTLAVRCGLRAVHARSNTSRESQSFRKKRRAHTQRHPSVSMMHRQTDLLHCKKVECGRIVVIREECFHFSKLHKRCRQAGSQKSAIGLQNRVGCYYISNVDLGAEPPALEDFVFFGKKIT